MIVWINGTFGVGKTTTVAPPAAPAARSRLIVGFMLTPALADHPVTDFQHWPPWRHLVIATAAELIAFTGQHLICPQTVLTRAYLEEIRAGLNAAGHHVHHVVLDAEATVLRSRIEASGEAVPWRLEHIEAYERARSWLREDADLVVDVGVVPPATAAATIAQDLQARGLLQT